MEAELTSDWPEYWPLIGEDGNDHEWLRDRLSRQVMGLGGPEEQYDEVKELLILVEVGTQSSEES